MFSGFFSNSFRLLFFNYFFGFFDYDSFFGDAEKAGAVVGRTVEAMGGIEKSSNQMLISCSALTCSTLVSLRPRAMERAFLTRLAPRAEASICPGPPPCTMG